MPKRGGSRGAKKPSLNSLSRASLTGEMMPDFLSSINDPRTLAVVNGAVCVTSLEQMLITKFVAMNEIEQNKLFYEPNSPLGSFANRIALAYALGLISADQRNDLDCIRRIRNVFAHAMIPLTFDHELIAAECKKLKLFYVKGIAEKDLELNRVRFASAAAAFLRHVNMTLHKKVKATKLKATRLEKKLSQEKGAQARAE